MVQTYFLGNDFETIKNSPLKIFWRKFLVQTFFLGNDFANITYF